ncbi:MAG: adenylate cyclase [Bacillota bacterium]
MKANILWPAAAAMVLAPALASAAPGGNSTSAPGYNHLNGPATTGQPDQDCEELVMSGEGAFPGNSTTAPGSAFNEDPGGTAGSVYAGEQPQNSRNTASVSQYDVACANQPQ